MTIARAMRPSYDRLCSIVTSHDDGPKRNFEISTRCDARSAPARRVGLRRRDLPGDERHARREGDGRDDFAHGRRVRVVAPELSKRQGPTACGAVAIAHCL